MAPRGVIEFHIPEISRPIHTLVIHCAATPPEMDVGVREIRKWHMDKGWVDIGYHGVIRRSGSYEEGRPYGKIGAHVAGHNKGSIGICLVGGVDSKGRAEDNFTGPQWHTLKKVVLAFRKRYPAIRIVGHREFDAGKECPSFDVQAWLNKIGV